MASQNIYSNTYPYNNYQQIPHTNFYNPNTYYPMYPPNQVNYPQYQQPMVTYPMDNYIYFYDDGKPYYEFTNFANYGFNLDGYYWPTSEHYFQAQKFEDYPNKMHQVQQLTSARDAFEYVRRPDNKLLARKDWPTCKDRIMYTALKAKFSQNLGLKKMLLDTGTKILVEDSPHDSYWGIGSDKQGKNRLGGLLMKLREELNSRTFVSIPTPPIPAPIPAPNHPIRRSSSMSRLTSIAPLDTDDATITYDADDSMHFLSNCYYCNFDLEGINWPTLLHYFVAKKFGLKPKHIKKISTLSDVRDVHRYSRDSKNNIDVDVTWNLDKKNLMSKALKAKFEQSQFLKRKLLDTGEAEIIERSSLDKYWSQDVNGIGRNIMGMLLSQVRSEVRFPPQFSPTRDLGVHSITSRMDRTSLYSPPRRAPKSPDSIHFYDSGPQAEYNEFSNFSIHGFDLDEKYWPSLQHYFQAQKYIDNNRIVEYIRKTNSPRQAYDLGKYYEEKYSKKDWIYKSEEVMKKALRAKFSDPILRHKLLETGDKRLIHDSKDDYWGIGKDGRGQNKLGVFLKSLREELLNTPSESLYPNPSQSKSFSTRQKMETTNFSPERDAIYFYDKAGHYFGFTPYSMHSFDLEGKWRTLNHYFQANKFCSRYYQNAIKDAKTPEEATKLAKFTYKYRSRDLPNPEKERIMKQGLEAKFLQNKDIAHLLINTGSKLLVFAHPIDSIWGAGSSSLGQNKLGKLLMELRNKLQNNSSSQIKHLKMSPDIPSPSVLSSDDDTKTRAFIRPIQGQRIIHYPPKSSYHKVFFSPKSIFLIFLCLIWYFVFSKTM